MLLEIIKNNKIQKKTIGEEEFNIIDCVFVLYFLNFNSFEIKK